MILGTAAYMSPEQARGRIIDKRADIWSFGVVMFEMLAGKRLFTGETASDTLAAVLRQDIDWSLLPQDLPAADRRLIERCLDRDPKKRLRDIGEARIALESKPVTETPSTANGTLSRRAWLGIAGAGLAGFAGGGALGYRARGASTPAASGATLSVTSITGSGNVIEAAISPDGRYVAYVESDQGLQSLWLLQLAGGQTLRLTPDAVVGFWGHTFTPDGNEIIYGAKGASDTEGSLYSISTLGGTPRRLLGNLDSQVSFSPDGRRFAYTRVRHPSAEETALMVANADGSDAKALATFKLPDMVGNIFFSAPAWSPDGAVISASVFRRPSVQGGDSKAWLVGVRVATGEVFTISDPGWYLAAQSAWRPDGRSLLVIARKADQPVTQIWSVDFPDGTARQVTSDLNDHRILSLTRDGKTLVSVSGDVSSAIYMDSRRGSVKPRRISRSKFDGFNGAAFAGPREIAYGASVGPALSLWKCGLDGSNRLPIATLAPDEDIQSIQTGADGAIYYVLRRPRSVEIRAVSGDGGSPRTVVSDARFDRFSLLPDGGVLFSRSVGGAPRLFRAAPGGGEATPIVEGVAFMPAADPAGKRVAYYFFDSKNQFRVGISDLETGKRLHDFLAEPVTSNSRLILRDEGVYLNTVTGDRANVWLQPLDGKPAKKITNYEDQLLFEFDLAPEGDAMLVVRGPRVRNAQIIRGF
jgi:Tol biopolymer transport system component